MPSSWLHTKLVTCPCLGICPSPLWRLEKRTMRVICDGEVEDFCPGMIVLMNIIIMT
jgi:hypothetical protein